MFSYPEAQYEGDPFPHAVIRGAWDQELLDRCKAEVRAFTGWDGEKAGEHARRKRYCSDPQKLPECVMRVIKEAGSERFLKWLEKLTGEPGLVADPLLFGGGIHSIRAGGFLKIHADFNYHYALRLYRRLNLLLYLNRDWTGTGDLELWRGPDCTKTVKPESNTMVVFTTDDESLHGHPHPMECGPDETRDSIALYYYSATEPQKNFNQVRLNTSYYIS